MSTQTQNPENTSPFYLEEVYLDFILSKKSVLVTDGVIRNYNSTIKKFIEWLADRGVTDSKEVSIKHIRAFLAELAARKLADNTLYDYAKNIRVFTRFMYFNEYIPKELKFDMPPIREKLLPVLNQEQLDTVLKACTTKRDKAIVLFLVDTGLRRSEALSLNWEHIDLKTGIVTIERGKMHKPRIVVIGVNTRKALFDYRREIRPAVESPLFQTSAGKRITNEGFRSLLKRVSKRAGIYFTPHALRRTFATLSLRAGMNPLHVQGLLGHSTLEMTRRYIRMIGDDLVDAHNQYSPIDTYLKK